MGKKKKYRGNEIVSAKNVKTNIVAINDKIDKFFEKVTVDELTEQLIDMGYTIGKAAPKQEQPS